jgi:uroporphyrin-III C-methyltransferase/precorrin-2 dehydrogenase/sirohydrochlorin ferrochelatase
MLTVLASGAAVQYLPLFVKLIDKPVLIVGGGSVALRKAGTLLSAGAKLYVVSPEFATEFIDWQREGKAELIKGYFEPALLDGKLLVIAATDNDSVNAAVFDAATARNMLVNTVDDQPKCGFIFPSIIDRNPIIIAISSFGTAPVLARRLREKLETLLPQHLGPLAQLVGRFRDQVKAKINGFAARRQFWEKVFNSDVVRDVQANQLPQAEERLAALLAEPQQLAGEVYVVGAGPGDPELLTLKALQLMQQADVVVYDYLVSPDIMQLVRRDAELICVGKKAGAHSVAQLETNKILVELALAGKKICRLKGGDPFIFGRGGEEIQALLAHNIAFQVVPGVTAAAGCAAYAGIPLTHRDHAQSVQFVTGHCRSDGSEPDWQSMSTANQTVVIYMGLMKAAHIQQQLLAAGRAASTPVAIIENGTRLDQRIITTELSTLAEQISSQQVQSPALLIIGEVVSLQRQLHWFGARPQVPVFAQPLTQLC